MGCKGVRRCVKPRGPSRCCLSFSLCCELKYYLSSTVLGKKREILRRGREGGRRRKMTGEEECRTEDLIAQGYSAVFILAQQNPRLYWEKTKGSKWQLLCGNSRLSSAKHRGLFQGQREAAMSPSQNLHKSRRSKQSQRTRELYLWRNDRVRGSAQTLWPMTLYCISCSHPWSRELYNSSWNVLW